MNASTPRPLSRPSMNSPTPDLEVYFDGRPSVLVLVPVILKAAVPGIVVALLCWWIDWSVLSGQTGSLIESVKENPFSLQTLLFGGVLVGGALAVALFLRGILTWLSTRYRLTSDRVEYERGILSKRIYNVELWRVRDVSYRRTLLQFFLGLGMIDILATDDTIPKLKVGPIFRARAIYDRLKQARLRAGRLAGPQAMGMSSWHEGDQAGPEL